MSKSWKETERRAARFFGAERQRLSGSSGRSDETTSDSTHPKIYIEAKRRKGFMAMLNQFKKIKEQAQKEDKVPLLWVQYGGDAVITIRAKDLDELAIWRKHEQTR